MITQPANSQNSIPVEIVASRNFIEWLVIQEISLAFTTYQSSRLMFLGVNSQGEISGFERIFDRAMGLYATTERIYLSCRYQIWQLDNALTGDQIRDGYDKLYIPRISYTTGDLDIHDLVVEKDQQRIIFVSSILNCLATVSHNHSCIPLWKPPFITALVNEDRCHLNGLAMVDGKARYVTACSQSDIVDGWRDRRQNGGCVIDIQSNEIIATGLSMPHAPRFYQGKLWLLNAGTGYFGYIDQKAGKFEPVTFCPGFLRGLAFVGDYAIVGLSKPRSRDKTFSGLTLDKNLVSKDAEPRCCLMVIDLKTGGIVHWLRLEGEVTELYDVQVLAGVKRPQALGFQNEEISNFITLDPISPLIRKTLPTKPQPNLHISPKTYDHFKVPYPQESKSFHQEIPNLSTLSNTSPKDELYQQAYNLQKQTKLDEAIVIYQKLINDNPQYAPAWYQIGVILDNVGKVDQAINFYNRALTINPDYAEAYNNLGIIAIGKREFAVALANFNQAIRSNPKYAFAYNNLGLALQIQGKLTEATVNFQAALQHNPNYPEAYLNLGIVLQSQDNLEGAIACYRSAIHHRPDYIKAHNYLGSSLLYLPIIGQDYLEEARKSFEAVLKIDSSNNEAFNNLFVVKEMSCDWQNREANLTKLWQQTLKEIQLQKPISVGLFDSLYKPWDRISLLQIAQIHGKSLETQWQKIRHSINFTHPPNLTGKLRIGYLSNDFRNHAISHLILSLFSLHDRSKFEIFVYSFGADDNSEYRQKIAASCNCFRDIINLSTEESAKLIFEDEIHILVDLKGYTSGCRTPILALKPAPIQVNYLGYPGTMGVDFIDYIIGDEVVTPPKFADAFTEKIVTLPGSYQVNDYQQPISSTPVTRAENGLPESGFVFCCFNNNYKIEPQIFDVWMKILAAVPNSVLWLFARYTPIQENLRREAEARGIPKERLIFAEYQPKPQHLARQQLADLFLDTLYYNAHTTASDALWAGVPMITCPGETFASRVGASLLTAVGLPELITSNLQEYANIAINLATSPAKFQKIKEKLAKNRTTYPLFDTPQFTRNLEQVYQKMWEIYADGESPREISLKPER